ncbi:hypothetical protein PghCCS26_47720 [Paenibacillus glycanilyticus]|uniref:Uncharacterized protein n=1 Tax=Paenibacillus glycanilyticus TaxID=126569 RepID=A0ABQ6NU24_9BACL|nr:hypothetical protein PghCCS26_47720 [Paenibacillus glycanilyticus]
MALSESAIRVRNYILVLSDERKGYRKGNAVINANHRFSDPQVTEMVTYKDIRDKYVHIKI